MVRSVADRRAAQIVEWLSPFCERIEIAGSIRRRRPLCNDIDLVVIPKVEPRQVKVDLLATATVSVNLVREHLIEYVRSSGGAAYWKGRTGSVGPEPKDDAQNLLLVTKAGVQLDVWCATPTNWFTMLICRTGSMQHNIWAAERARELHGHWQPYKGLRSHGLDVPLNSEEDFYRGLGVPFILPQDRESAHITWLMQEARQ